MFKYLLKFLLIVTVSNTILYADKLVEIKKKGILKVGVKYDFKPFGFLNENGEVVGFDIDLVKYIADDLDVALSLVEVSSKSRIPLLLKKEIDLIAASMTHTMKRDEDIDFTDSYFLDYQALLVRSYAKEKKLKDFSGKSIGVMHGSTSAKAIEEKNPEAKVVYFQESIQALLALKRGKIAAISTDFAWCTTKVIDSKGVLKVLNEQISVQPYGMGVNENQSNYRDAINLSLQKAKKDGTYDDIYLKWFGEYPQKIKMALPIVRP